MTRRRFVLVILAGGLVGGGLILPSLSWTLRITAALIAAVPLLLWVGLALLRGLGRGMDPVRAANLARFQDAERPDGQVGLARMEGVESEPLLEGSPWRRFIRQDPATEVVPAALDARNPPLLGRVVIVSLFLGRYGTAWSAEEVAESLENLERAALWIEDEAERSSARVNLDLADVVFLETVTIEDDVEVVVALEGTSRGLWDRDSAVKHLSAVSRAAKAFGFADAAEMLSRINPRLGGDSVVWILHHRCAGRSLAIPAALAELPGVGIAVCYSRYANLPEPLDDAEPPWSEPLTLAHELFHLFGATDKYGEPLASFPPGTVRPRDIMRMGARTLIQHEVGPLTAYEVGWILEPVSLSPDAPATGQQRETPGPSRSKGPGVVIGGRRFVSSPTLE